MDLAPGPQLNGFLLYQQKQSLGYGKHMLDGSALQGKTPVIFGKAMVIIIQKSGGEKVRETRKPI